MNFITKLNFVRINIDSVKIKSSKGNFNGHFNGLIQHSLSVCLQGVAIGHVIPDNRFLNFTEECNASRRLQIVLSSVDEFNVHAITFTIRLAKRNDLGVNIGRIHVFTQIQKILAKLNNLTRTFPDILHKVNVGYTAFSSDVEVPVVIAQVHLIFTNLASGSTDKISRDKVPDPASVAAFQMFSVASFATGQYFLADISSKLTEVNRKLDDLLVFLQASKRTELLSELTFVKYALANYSTVMLSEPQRMATIANLQRAKIKAVADMEFYTEQLEDSVGVKTNENQARIVLQNKQGIDLASQLYAISTIMEAYYAQNWNKSYLANINADAKPLFALTQNRMIGALKTFSDKINKEIESKKKGLLKGDVSASEHKILDLLDTLNAQPESPLLALVKDALDKPSAPTELYLRPNGEVYQKVV